MKNPKPREKVGKISHDLWDKKPESYDVTEQMLEQLDDYDHNIWLATERGIKEINGNFFIVVITKKERLMPNVIRNYFATRSTCPTPDYDQTVYKFDRKANMLDFLWVIPSKQACLYLKDNALQVEQKELLQFVLDFSDGTLMKKAMHLNNELEGI